MRLPKIRVRTGTRRATLLSVATLGLGLLVFPASAGNFNYANDTVTCSGQPCPQTNKSFYRYHDANLSVSWENAVNATHWSTFTNVPGWNSYNTVVHNDADVHYLLDSSLPPEYVGLYLCSAQSSGGQTCDHGHVRFNPTAQYNSWGASRKEAVACHETAHSVGLGHPVPDTSGQENTYGCVASRHVFGASPDTVLRSHNEWHMQFSNPY